MYRGKQIVRFVFLCSFGTDELSPLNSRTPDHGAADLFLRAYILYMSKLNSNLDRKVLPIGQLSQFIEAVGAEQTVIVRGRTGIGKTYVARQLAKKLGWPFLKMDMTAVSDGDIRIPTFRETIHGKVVEYAPNELLGLHNPDQPVVVLFDELGKANRAARDAVLPLLEAEDRHLGHFRPHPSSIFMATTNLAEEGLGDTLKAHQINRCSFVEAKGPTSDEWVSDFATANNVHPTIIAFAKEFPSTFGDFRDYKPDDNKYIVHPGAPNRIGTTPRSFAAASRVLRNLEAANASEDTILVALAGTFGDAAAADFMTTRAFESDVPAWSSIMKTPKKASIPSQPASKCILIHTALQSIKSAADMGAWMQYFLRLDGEMQGMWSMLALHHSVNPIATSHPAWVKWIQEGNYKLFAS